MLTRQLARHVIWPNKVLKRGLLDSGEIPFEPLPQNRYNALRSAFNIKPRLTQGMVHNPPAAARHPSIKSPRIFLPPNDPRRQLPPSRVYTAAELENYPIINLYAAPGQRIYDVLATTVAEICKLRNIDPTKWTISALSKKFDIPANKVNVFTKSLPRDLPVRKTVATSERVRRSKLWLRGEF